MERWMILETCVGIPNHHTYSLNDRCFEGRLSAKRTQTEFTLLVVSNINKIKLKKLSIAVTSVKFH